MSRARIGCSPNSDYTLLNTRGKGPPLVNLRRPTLLSWEQMRLLVVEDEKRIADFLCRGLEGAGYAVDAAPNGATALEHIHSADYDLVVLDLMLPDMDGLQVLEKIRNRKVGPPVLILSARGALDDRVKGLEQGADDYLVK